MISNISPGRYEVRGLQAEGEINKKSICLLNDNITENNMKVMLFSLKTFFVVLCFSNSQTMGTWRLISLGYTILGCQYLFDLPCTVHDLSGARWFVCLLYFYAWTMAECRLMISAPEQSSKTNNTISYCWYEECTLSTLASGQILNVFLCFSFVLVCFCNNIISAHRGGY